MMITATRAKKPAPKNQTLRFDAETRKAIESARDGLAHYKGQPWSYTEYNCALASSMDHLAQKYGDAAAQELLRLMDSVPVRGGRFNSWSGD
jgi:hypothetical protein